MWSSEQPLPLSFVHMVCKRPLWCWFFVKMQRCVWLSFDKWSNNNLIHIHVGILFTENHRYIYYMTFCWHNDNSLKRAFVHNSMYFSLLQRKLENSGNSILFEVEFLDKNEKNIHTHYTGEWNTKMKNLKWKCVDWHWYSWMKINFLKKFQEFLRTQGNCRFLRIFGIFL